jgi:hypothetical protein
MSYFRSYFEKNNTILKDHRVNTAKNPNTEIYYGGGFSKFIFKVNFTNLIEKINNGEYINDNNTKHYLRMTNTIFGDESLKGGFNGRGKERAVSFDLILFRINEFWDEGVGFDYEISPFDFVSGNNVLDERPSNWYNRTTLNSWSENGIYSNNPDIISTIHFDNGDENINLDITDYVNGIIESREINNGVGLAFSVVYQDATQSIDQSVSFFTKYTQTFFEPFVESVFSDRISDNRQNFIGNVYQNLYLYITKGTNFYDLNYEPLVDILDSNGNIIPGLQNQYTTKVKKGVYVVTFAIDGTLCDGRRFFFDKWKNLEIDGTQINDVTQKFVPKPFTAQYTIGENQTELQKYVVQITGIKQNEKIKKGTNKKLIVTFRSIDVPKSQLFEEVYYRIFIKEGKTEVIVHDWTQLDVTNENSFFLDTSYLIAREYQMEIKGKTHTEEIFYNEYIKFEIINEK